MKNHFRWAICLLSCVVMSASYAGLFGSHNEAAVGEAMNTWMAQNNVPGVAVVLYVDGKPSSYYYGYADKEKKLSVTEKSIFELGAVADVMTNLMIAEEVDFARMGLKDPLKKYVNPLPDEMENSTLQELATQTIGESWQLSSSNSTLLGKVLEKSTAKDYDWLYFHHVTALLGMRHLGVTVQDKYKDDLAQGYTREGLPDNQLSSAHVPSIWRAKSSGVDMQKFLSAAIGLPGTPERVFYPMRMTQSVHVKLTDRMQGLGWQIYSLENSKSTLINKPVIPDEDGLAVIQVLDLPLFDEKTLIDKAGATTGFGAYIAVLPNKKAGIVILANKQVADDSIARIGREILLKLA